MISHSVTKEVIKQFGKKVRLIALIGSGNTDDFDLLSDIDYVLVLDSFSADDLKFISSLRDELSAKNDIPIDIKLYTVLELKAAKKYPIGVFHAWTLHMILKDRISIFYQNKIKLSPFNGDERLSAIISVNYFIDKLKKYLSIEKTYLRGKITIPNNKEAFKVINSCCFCIAKFFLYYEGVSVFSRGEIINGIRKMKISPKILVDLDNFRKSKKYEINRKTRNKIVEFCNLLYSRLLKEVAQQ